MTIICSLSSFKYSDRSMYVCCSRQIFDIDFCGVSIILQSLFIPFLPFPDKGIMAQPDIKQEPLSPTDRILPSCSQDGEMEEVTRWILFLEKSVFLPVVNIPSETNLSYWWPVCGSFVRFLKKVRIPWSRSQNYSSLNNKPFFNRFLFLHIE